MERSRPRLAHNCLECSFSSWLALPLVSTTTVTDATETLTIVFNTQTDTTATEVVSTVTSVATAVSTTYGFSRGVASSGVVPSASADADAASRISSACFSYDWRVSSACSCYLEASTTSHPPRLRRLKPPPPPSSRLDLPHHHHHNHRVRHRHRDNSPQAHQLWHLEGRTAIEP